MEDKSFDLLTEMYAEFINKFDNIYKNLNGIDRSLDEVDKRLAGK